MRVLVVYDIVCDRRRAKVADACQDYGLDRVQFSAFTGNLSRNHQRELIRRIADLMDGSACRIVLIPICESDWDKRLEVEHAGDQ